MAQQTYVQAGYQPMPAGQTVVVTTTTTTGGFWYTTHKPLGRAQVKQWAGANEWATPMLTACVAEPVTCLLGVIAPWCCVYQQRVKLLMGNMAYYECCAGMWGPYWTDCCNGYTSGNEAMCLCLESTFCLSCAIHGNRWMVMQHYNLSWDCCDIAIIWIACICGIIGAIIGNEHLENLANQLYYLTIGCMLAQHEHQMKVQGYPMGVFPVAPIMQ
jgi:hypothetical protein